MSFRLHNLRYFYHRVSSDKSNSVARRSLIRKFSCLTTFVSQLVHAREVPPCTEGNPIHWRDVSLDRSLLSLGQSFWRPFCSSLPLSLVSFVRLKDEQATCTYVRNAPRSIVPRNRAAGVLRFPHMCSFIFRTITRALGLTLGLTNGVMSRSTSGPGCPEQRSPG